MHCNERKWSVFAIFFLLLRAHGYCTFTRLWIEIKLTYLFGDTRRWDANFILHCKFASVQCTDLSKIHVYTVQKSRSYLSSSIRLMNFYLLLIRIASLYPRCKFYWPNKRSNLIWREKDNFLDILLSTCFFFKFARQTHSLFESYHFRRKYDIVKIDSRM